MKDDTVGVFISSADESDIENFFDRQYGISVSEFAASILHYPQTILSMATSVSNHGSFSMHSLLVVVLAFFLSQMIYVFLAVELPNAVCISLLF